MKSMWPSDKTVSYESETTLEAKSTPGVRYTIRRISFALRGDLARRVRELSGRAEFHAAGDSVQDRIEASVLANEIDQLYLRWGLAGLSGLTIDGEEATVETLIAKGPEDLALEIAAAVKRQIGLTEEERKN